MARVDNSVAVGPTSGASAAPFGQRFVDIIDMLSILRVKRSSNRLAVASESPLFGLSARTVDDRYPCVRCCFLE